MDETDGRLLTAGDLAKILRCTRNHSWHLMSAGAIPGVIDVSSPGSSKAHLRVREADLDAWLQSRSLKAVS
jgi:hypothetical protein